MDERTDPATAKRYGMPPESREPDQGQRGQNGRRLLVGLIVLAVIAGAIVWAHPWGGKRTATSFAAPPQPVGVATATTGAMPVTLNALGTVTPIAAVTVQSRVDGELMKVGFQEGQMVKKGQFLAEIDPRPYQVALEQAQGQLAHDTALLRQAQSDLARYQKLEKQRSIAQQQVADQSFLVQQYQGTVQTDQAAIDNAKLNLTYCHIIAPITGRVGLRQVDPGNYVQSATDTNGIVVITQLHPISVVFSLPQKDIAAVTKAMAGKTPLPVAAYD
ncbi:MAG: efflux RND transporter periplasmic adaptor subunit, partial [Acetobacteraceae bacterium]